jgi:4,5-DOPA dioxygenase extradiol
MVALEQDDFTRALEEWSAKAPPPSAILVMSAHWEQTPVGATASARPPLIYDFGGFPPKLHRYVYPCPGAPELAAAVVERLTSLGIPALADRERGLDHGVWVPLARLYPRAAIPVVELSVPGGGAIEATAAIGAALAPLRERGVLLMGSGGVVHNLARVDLARKHAPAPEWARTFDAWAAERIAQLDADGLSRWANAPQGPLAVPTPEHFAPVGFALGAAQGGDRVQWIYQGFHHGSLSMRSFAVGGG